MPYITEKEEDDSRTSDEASMDRSVGGDASEQDNWLEGITAPPPYRDLGPNFESLDPWNLKLGSGVCRQFFYSPPSPSQ